MKIDTLMLNSGADIYYDKAFRDTLEAHMDYLRKSDKTVSRPVDSHKATVYEGDLFGYLLELNVPLNLHWVTMRVNNFFSPYEFGAKTQFLLIPESTEIDIVRQSQKTAGSILV